MTRALRAHAPRTPCIYMYIIVQLRHIILMTFTYMDETYHAKIDIFIMLTTRSGA